MSEYQYYVAYGSNLNIEQMKSRCPTAEIVGSALLNDYKLIFSSVASICPSKGSHVPVGVWRIDGFCEKKLDRYEGFPWLYRKEFLKLCVEGKPIEAMVYIMNDISLAPPNSDYYQTIRQGYRDFELDETVLETALFESYEPSQRRDAFMES